MGDMSEYTPKSDTSLFFWPIDVKNVKYVGTSDRDHFPLKIVHAPNHRHYKGTDYLIETVGSLQREGLPLKLVMVEKIPNQEAMKIYEDADIIAEQFLIGWHGFMAIEAMALGKPVISYVRKKSYILNSDECPIISANPDNLKEVIRDLSEDPYKRRELGKQGRAYVEKYFSLEAFSERLARLYQKHGILG
jgi:glycosyltransferase involved in cell wall biosynthesis